MGVTVIKSPCGEAEKCCAYLNLIGRCDGVITDDSDVFLYGARCVYKNFCMDKKSDIKIEKYSMDRIENDLGYTREHLLVLGLILGCDYDARGVPGVGKENATKFLSELAELNKTRSVNALELVRNWRKPDYKTNGLKYEDRIRKAVLTNGDIIFPNEKIIQEYMSMPKLAQILLSQEKYLTIYWKRPNLKDCQVNTKIKRDYFAFDHFLK
jgi:5'-3' exonuclease